VRFLNEEAFQTPKFLLDPEVLGRIEPFRSPDRVEEAERWILESLLDQDRLGRLLQHNVYTPEAFFPDLRHGVWSEIYAGKSIDSHRAALQRAYLELLAERFFYSTSLRASVGGELSILDREITKALANTQLDLRTRFHLEDARRQISRALDPKFAPLAPSPRKTPSFPLRFDSETWPFE